VDGWPVTHEDLESEQRRLAALSPPPWRPPRRPYAIGAVFVAFSTRMDPSPRERAWAAAVLGATRSIVSDEIDAPYEPGYLALREGPILERAVRGLGTAPEVLLVNASGRDHPRGAGLALPLGAALEIPTVGVTDRPLIATRDERDRLLLGGHEVGRVVTGRAGARPVMAHAAWRTDAAVAEEVARAAIGRARTPEPLRLARFLARSQRARDEGRLPSGWQMDRLDAPRFPRAGSVAPER
jgi:deoxyribonuclease V